jgi:hypothetical protein
MAATMDIDGTQPNDTQSGRGGGSNQLRLRAVLVTNGATVPKELLEGMVEQARISVQFNAGAAAGAADQSPPGADDSFGPND